MKEWFIILANSIYKDLPMSGILIPVGSSRNSGLSVVRLRIISCTFPEIPSAVKRSPL